MYFYTSADVQMLQQKEPMSDGASLPVRLCLSTKRDKTKEVALSESCSLFVLVLELYV